MVKCLIIVLVSLFGLFVLVGCETVNDDSDGSVDTDIDTEVFIDTDTDTNYDTEMPYTWEEGYIYPIQDQDHYDWVIQQRNVMVAFVNSNGTDTDALLNAATTVMEEKLPWLWLAKAELSEVPEVFANAGVKITPTLKFYSYGVEMDELTLTTEQSIIKSIETQVAVNAQVLIDRYAPDVLKPTTDEELDAILFNPAIPVMLKFGAPWCGPCNFMIPRMELASIEYGDELLDAEGNYIYDQKRFTIVEVDIGEIPSTILTYKLILTGIPFYVLTDGIQYYDGIGITSYQDVSLWIDLFLSYS